MTGESADPRPQQLAFYSDSLVAVATLDDQQIKAICWLLTGRADAWTREAMVDAYQKLLAQEKARL